MLCQRNRSTSWKVSQNTTRETSRTGAEEKSWTVSHQWNASRFPASERCGLLQTQHAVCRYTYSHIMRSVTATPHCGLLQPHHIMVCYHHIVRPVTATLHHGLLPPHNVATHGCYFSARWLVWLGGSHHFTSVHIASNDLCFSFNPKPCQVKRRVKLWHQVQYCVVVYTNQCEWSSVSVG